MKKIISITLLAVVVLCGFSSCEDATKGTATYYGVVLNQYTDAPLSGASVKVTNGDKIHTTTTTAGDGSFSVEVRLAEINQDYYILIGGTRIVEKKVTFPAYGNGKYDVGTILVKGPTDFPIVETKVIRADSKTQIFCEGIVVDEGEAPVTARGICWGTSTPSIKNKKVECGEGKGGFSGSVSATDVHKENLYFRAYATNEYGTTYGETIMLDHRNPYNLPVVKDQSSSFIVLPYDLVSSTMYGSYNAYNKCSNLVAYDYDDWELPALSVLQLIYKNKNSIGGFTNKPYWSSSNKSSYYYYYVDFSNGTVDYQDDDYYAEVRPVRKY
ncbi:MAG: hypothetical protein IJ915_02145 [Paludibacteraceae bacterium]|nr:hypothetical protein [Paludibacteraceae bacterium]